MLLSAGALTDVATTGGRGWTPLMFAAGRGHPLVQSNCLRAAEGRGHSRVKTMRRDAVCSELWGCGHSEVVGIRCLPPGQRRAVRQQQAKPRGRLRSKRATRALGRGRVAALL